MRGEELLALVALWRADQLTESPSAPSTRRAAGGDDGAPTRSSAHILATGCQRVDSLPARGAQVPDGNRGASTRPRERPGRQAPVDCDLEKVKGQGFGCAWAPSLTRTRTCSYRRHRPGDGGEV